MLADQRQHFTHEAS